MKALLAKIVSGLLAFEAVMHFVFPAISFYGMYQTGTWNWMIALTPVADVIFGFICLAGSYLLGTKHHHHH